MESTLQAVRRDGRGKNEARRLRASGRIPAVVYGAEKDTAVEISVDPKMLLRILHSESGVNSLIALQLVVTLLRLEISPLLSTYVMYATTYSSPAEYEQKAGQAYWIVGVDSEAQPHRCRITRGEADAIAGAAATEPRATGARMRRCFDPSLDIRNVSLEATRMHIDWERWERLDEPIRVPITSAIPLE